MLNRYCCRRVVISQHKYLLCSAILRIAARYQENHTALFTAMLGSITIQSEGAYNVSNLNQIEWHILEVLDWQFRYLHLPSTRFARLRT